MKDQALSSTAPAHGMYEMSFIVLASGAAGVLQMRRPVLSSTTPAHRMYQMSFIVRTSWQAGLLPDEGPSAFTIPISVDIARTAAPIHNPTTPPGVCTEGLAQRVDGVSAARRWPEQPNATFLIQ